MNIVSWNCRGMGNLRAVPNLKDLIRTYKTNILFLFETLVHVKKN